MRREKNATKALWKGSVMTLSETFSTTSQSLSFVWMFVISHVRVSGLGLGLGLGLTKLTKLVNVVTAVVIASVS